MILTREQVEELAHIMELPEVKETDAALRANRDQWKDKCEQLDTELIAWKHSAANEDALRDEIAELEAKVAAYEGGALHDQLVAQAQRIEQLEAQLAACREALKVFADLGGGYDMPAYHDLDNDVVIYKNSGFAITAGDVRHAREVLK